MPPPSKVALLFIDGVGVGARDGSVNPLVEGEFLVSQFADGSGSALPRSGRRIDVDTTFGVPGRPQSASNQTAIFTGLPAPRLIGEHVLGYPNRALAALLSEASIVKRLIAGNRTATFANGYPVGYLDALGLKRREGSAGSFEMPAKYKRRIKPSATTLTFGAGGVALRTFDDVIADAALTHDIDGAAANERFAVTERTPEAAAEIFWKISEDFTLFEHHLADEAGHEQDRGAAVRALTTFDRFAREIVRLMPDDAQVLICSDHGNVEDLSTRGHTTNPVAILAFGTAPVPRLASVADVGTLVLNWLGCA